MKLQIKIMLLKKRRRMHANDAHFNDCAHNVKSNIFRKFFQAHNRGRDSL